MWEAIVGWFKGLFGGKDTTQIGKDNQSISGSSTGENSPVVTAGRDVHFFVTAPSFSQPQRRSRVEELVEWMRTYGPEKPLNQVLPRALELAQLSKDADFEHWVRMELIGYTREGGMTEQDTVPEYRAVTGRYVDHHDRMLHVTDPELGFVNTYRFRYGVSTLEEFVKTTDMISIRDEGSIDLIRKHFHVEVFQFCFSPIEIVAVLNTIRNRLLETVYSLENCKVQ